MNLHIICTNTLVGDHLVLKWTLFSETSRSNGTMTAILNRLMPRARQTDINKKVHSGVDCQTLTKYSATFFASVTEHFGEIMQ